MPESRMHNRACGCGAVARKEGIHGILLEERLSPTQEIGFAASQVLVLGLGPTVGTCWGLTGDAAEEFWASLTTSCPSKHPGVVSLYKHVWQRARRRHGTSDLFTSLVAHGAIQLHRAMLLLLHM